MKIKQQKGLHVWGIYSRLFLQSSGLKHFLWKKNGKIFRAVGTYTQIFIIFGTGKFFKKKNYCKKNILSPKLRIWKLIYKWVFVIQNDSHLMGDWSDCVSIFFMSIVVKDFLNKDRLFILVVRWSFILRM